MLFDRFRFEIEPCQRLSVCVDWRLIDWCTQDSWSSRAVHHHLDQYDAWNSALQPAQRPLVSHLLILALPPTLINHKLKPLSLYICRICWSTTRSHCVDSCVVPDVMWTQLGYVNSSTSQRNDVTFVWLTRDWCMMRLIQAVVHFVSRFTIVITNGD